MASNSVPLIHLLDHQSPVETKMLIDKSINQQSSIVTPSAM